MKLITTSKENTLELFSKEKGLDPVLEELRRAVDSFEPDTSTVKGRKEIASLAHRVAKSKTYLDGLGKDLVSDWKEKAKVVDAERKRIRDEIDALKAKVRAPLDEWEAEEARKAKEREELIANIKAAGSATGKSLDALRADLDYLLNLPAMDEELDSLKAEAITQANQQVIAEEQREAERAELERLRAAEAERKEKERIEAERLAKEQREREIAEQARREAEERAAAEAERIKREKAEAEERAVRLEREKAEAEERAEREAQEAAERARVTELKRQEEEKAKQAAEQARREADQAHTIKIMSEAKESLMALDIDEEMARVIVRAIKGGNIKNVVLRF